MKSILMLMLGFVYGSVNVYVNIGVKVIGKRLVILLVWVLLNVNDNVDVNMC